MTQYDIENYYSAIDKSKNLLIVPATDRIDDIVAKMNDKLKNGITTINAEIIHDADNVQSYIIVCTGENICDTYSGKQKILIDKTIMETASYITNQLPVVVKSPYHSYVDRKDNNGNYIIKSFTDGSEYALDTEQLHILITGILGVQINTSGKTEIHPVNHISGNDIADFMHLTENIQDDGIRLYAKTCLQLIPDYVITEPSGLDSSLYPADNIATGGLKRRIMNTFAMMKLLTSQNYAHTKFSKTEIDMMLTACIFCDAWHNGWQEDYQNDASVKFNHPEIAANALRCVAGIISSEKMKFITDCIAAHMGQNNKSKTMEKTLPVPSTEFEYTVHLANFITKQQNVCLSANNIWYHYSDEKIENVTRKNEISEDDIAIIENAISEKIDMPLAKKLGIKHMTEQGIKNKWRFLTKEKTVSENDLKYIELAKKLMIL